MEDVKEKETIGMLLNLDHFYGEHEGRLGPLLGCLCLSGAPVLFYVYFGLFNIIPLWVFIPLEIFFSIRVVMIIKGREKYRLKKYLKQFNDDYTNTATLLNTKIIHPDGCVEYRNGTIVYLVCCFNGTSDDEVLKSVQLRKLLESMLDGYVFDIYIHNLNDSPELREYYNNVASFDKNLAAKNFIKMIDHSIDLTEDSSAVMCTTYVIKGRRSDWKNIKSQIDSAINSNAARCYKKIYRVSDPDAINSIFNRDSDSIVNVEDLQRRKYATHEYDSSKVLAYDLPEDKELVQGTASIKPVIPKTSNSGFHVKYKED